MSFRLRAPSLSAALLAILSIAACRGVLEIEGEYRERSAAPAEPDAAVVDAATPDTGVPPCEVSSCPTPQGDCARSACVDGECGMEPLQLGEDCESEGGRVCDGLGSCVACLVDQVRGPRETDVDCGGPDCEPCAAGLACDRDGDCDSGVCHVSGLCDTPRCNDDVRNGSEGGVDCGGDCLKPCEQGADCVEDEDCETSHCSDGVCCGVACTGLCEQCVAGTGACTLIADDADPEEECEGVTNFCNGAGSCTGCGDLGKNGFETDVDCGGTECARCAVGLDCAVDSDCDSCLCEADACAAPRCENSERDGCETDVDCGGPCGETCGDGQACTEKLDCASHACVDGSCEGP